MQFLVVEVLSLFTLFCVIFSQLRNRHSGTSPLLLSAILTRQCGMLTLESLPITRGSTVLVAYFGCWLGWFSRCVGLLPPDTNGMWW